MPLLNFLERRRQLFWSVNNYPNLMLHGIADVERNLRFYGYNSPESAYPKGKGLFYPEQREHFCKAVSQEMHRKGAKHLSLMPVFLQIY